MDKIDREFTKNLKNRYKILTPDGFVDFDGLLKTKNKETCFVYTSSSHLCCTLDHKVLLHNGSWLEACKLKPKNQVVVNGKNEYVTSICLSSNRDVYDVIEAGDKHQYITNGFISHNCEFLGSSGTLISGDVLKRLAHRTPEQLLVDKKFKVYDHPQKDKTYAMTLDMAEGLGQDYTVATIFDITKMPYKVVGVYRDNKISPLVMPEIISGLGKLYNDAHLLIELNSAGKQVADIIRFDYDYDNLMYVSADAKNGQVLMGTGAQQPGLKTSKTTKKVGCSLLKELLENNKLIVEDFDAISELATFIRVNDSYAADELANDDVVMTLVLFAWMTNQTYFNSLNDVDIRKELYEQQMQEVENSILGFISPQYESNVVVEETMIDAQGIIWSAILKDE